MATLTNETINLIAQRYSCRAFLADPLTQDELQALAMAAVQAPSAMNKQPWRIIMVTNPDLLQEMETEGMRILAQAPDKSAYDLIQSRGGKLFYSAPCMAMLPILPGGELDCGIVCENIVLAAKSLGIDSVICGMARIPLSGEKGAALKEKMGFPEGFDFGMAVLLGHAAKEPVPPHTPDLSKIRYV